MESLETLKPAMLKKFDDPRTGLNAFVVIDRQLHGSATGGIRMTDDVTVEEVANLAHEMALKFAFLRIKKDGAKAGIVAPAGMTLEIKKTLCRAFGAAIRDMVRAGQYCPGEDIGITAADFAGINAGIGLSFEHRTTAFPSDFFTALTVFISIEELLRSRGIDLPSATIIIEGFGKVAEKLALLLASAGAVIRGVSTVFGGMYDERGFSVQELIASKRKHDERFVTDSSLPGRIPREHLLEQPADVLVPGARPDSIHEGNARAIAARCIVPIANIPATEQVEELLFQHGIPYLPGFVANSGGVLSFFLREQMFDTAHIEEIIRFGFPRAIKRLIAVAEHNRQSYAHTARRIAAAHIAEAANPKNRSLIRKVTGSRVLWITRKLLSRIDMGFFLRGFARQYIIKKHFEDL